MSRNAFLSVFYVKLALLIFLSGKLIRFFFFLVFIFFLLKSVDNLAGYSLNQTIFFFLTFNFIDVAAQFLFREVYRFRPLVVTGGLDLILVKPMNALFRSLMGGADVIDLITIPPLIAAIWYVGRLLNPSSVQVIIYILLILNGLVIAAAFHILVLSFGILTLEIDHTIMIYRDFVNLGKLPVDIYKEPVKGILTFIFPVAIMTTLPAKYLMGLVTYRGVLISLSIGVLLTLISFKVWNHALKSYSSASS